MRFCLKDTACSFQLPIATLIASFYTEFFYFISFCLITSFLNRMSLISLSFLSLPSSSSLTPGSSPDSCQTALPVWLQFGVLFFFFSLYLFYACVVHACTYTHKNARVNAHFLCQFLNTAQYLMLVKVCLGTLRGFQGPLECNVLYF